MVTANGEGSAERRDSAPRRRAAACAREDAVQRRASEAQQGDAGQGDHDKGPWHAARAAGQGRGPVGPLWMPFGAVLLTGISGPPVQRSFPLRRAGPEGEGAPC